MPLWVSMFLFKGVLRVENMTASFLKGLFLRPVKGETTGKYRDVARKTFY